VLRVRDSGHREHVKSRKEFDVFLKLVGEGLKAFPFLFPHSMKYLAKMLNIRPFD